MLKVTTEYQHHARNIAEAFDARTDGRRAFYDAETSGLTLETCERNRDALDEIVAAFGYTVEIEVA